jgi:hypothetical protein
MIDQRMGAKAFRKRSPPPRASPPRRRPRRLPLNNQKQLTHCCPLMSQLHLELPMPTLLEFSGQGLQSFGPPLVPYHPLMQTQRPVPSSLGCVPSCKQVTTMPPPWQTPSTSVSPSGQAQTPFWQVCVETVHEPHCKLPPHVSGCAPQVAPRAKQVVGVQTATQAERSAFGCCPEGQKEHWSDPEGETAP